MGQVGNHYDHARRRVKHAPRPATHRVIFLRVRDAMAATASGPDTPRVVTGNMTAVYRTGDSGQTWTAFTPQPAFAG